MCVTARIAKPLREDGDRKQRMHPVSEWLDTSVLCAAAAVLHYID